jgi:hypothetical protein
MIGNKATHASPGEGMDHYQTKVVVGQVVDQSIGPLVSEVGWKLLTMYEFPFIPLKLEDYQDFCDRCYVGDVVALLFRSKQHFRDAHNKIVLSSWSDLQKSAAIILNFEVDGTKGHSTTTEKKKNRIRDDELKKHYNIEVCRIPVLGYKSRKKEDTYDVLKEEVTDFYFNRTKVILNAR